MKPESLKRLLAVFGILVVDVCAFGQGEVDFNNLYPAQGIYAIVTDLYGQPLSGTSARAALLGGPAATGVPYTIFSASCEESVDSLE